MIERSSNWKGIKIARGIARGQHTSTYGLYITMAFLAW